MAVRKQEQSPVTKKDLEDALRARDVVLEDIRSQMQLVLEVVTSTRESTREEMRALETRLSDRISVLESVVRENSADIRKNSEDIRKISEDLKRNTDDLRGLREEVAGLRRDFDRRPELERLKALEERVARVEAKIGSR